MKLDLCRVTAICVDGRPQTAETLERYRAILAYMMSKVQFGCIKMLLTSDPNIHEIDFIQIPEMNVDGYSNFCIKDMFKYIDTDFCLIFQEDGFILNPNLWTDEFFRYDYIGAPWPLYIGWPIEGQQVGNGGFSLRSKRLLNFIKDFECKGNEDVVIANVYRSEIDSAGFTFAPVEVARKFSVEIPIDSDHTLDSSFGFHSKNLLTQAIEKIGKS